MVALITQRFERHHGIGHGREDAAEAILAIQPLENKPFGLGQRLVAAAALGPEWRGLLQHLVEGDEHLTDRGTVRIRVKVPYLGRITDKQLLNINIARVTRLWLQRHHDQQWRDYRARPVADLGHVEREPLRQQHDLNRHYRYRAPWQLPEQAKSNARKDVAALGTTGSPDRPARLLHMRRVDIIADQLEREIGFHTGADIHIAIMEQRPATALLLPITQIIADQALDFRLRLTEEMAQKNVFRGNGGIGLELENPVPVITLEINQAVTGLGHNRGQPVPVYRRNISGRRSAPLLQYRGIGLSVIERCTGAHIAVHDHRNPVNPSDYQHHMPSLVTLAHYLAHYGHQRQNCAAQHQLQVPVTGNRPQLLPICNALKRASPIHPVQGAVSTSDSTAIRPERTAPSIVAGSPVSIQSPASQRLRGGP